MIFDVRGIKEFALARLQHLLKTISQVSMNSTMMRKRPWPPKVGLEDICLDAGGGVHQSWFSGLSVCVVVKYEPVAPVRTN